MPKIVKKMENGKKTSHFKPFWATFFVLAILLVTQIQPVSAMDWDNKQKFIEGGKYGYGKYEVYDSFILGIGYGKKIIDLELKENTNVCSFNCNSSQEVTLYEDGKMVDDVRFYKKDAYGDSYPYNLIDYKVYYKGKGDWQEYELGSEVKAGSYEVKIEAEKGVYDSIDWQIQSNGIWSELWAWWSGLEPVQLYERYIDTGNNARIVGGTEWKAQTFTAGTTGEDVDFWIGNVTVRIDDWGDPSGLLRAEIQGVDGANKPDGNTIAFGTMDIATVPAGATNMNITMNGSIINSGTQYALVLTHTEEAGTGVNWWDNEGSDNYAGGSYASSSDSGSSWTLEADRDFVFLIWSSHNGTVTATPTHYQNFGRETIWFNCTGDAPPVHELVNVSLWTNISETDNAWVRTNFTDLSGSPKSHRYTYNFTNNIYGAINFSCEFCDEEGNCGHSVNRTIFGDRLPPIVSLTAPIDMPNYNEINITTSASTEYLNFTITDENLHTIWYDYNFTNTTVCDEGGVLASCVSGNAYKELYQIEYLFHNITLWANDSYGNNATEVKHHNYKTFGSGFSFNKQASEGGIETFKTNFTINETTDVDNLRLYYNGSYYATTLNQLVGTNYSASATIQIPYVDASGPVQWFWNFELDSGEKYNTTSHNQTVSNFGLDDCTNYVYKLFNATLKDEESQIILDGPVDNTSVKWSFSVKNPITLQEVANYTNHTVEINPATVCLESAPENSVYRIDGTIEYEGPTARFREYYILQNFTLKNNTMNQNLTLYDLNVSSGDEYQITYKDENFNPVENAIIQVQRKYIDEGLFKVVEQPKTNTFGKTTVHLTTDDAIYNFVILKDGEILATFQDTVAICQNPNLQTCEINLNSFASFTSPTDYIISDDFSSTLTYNKDTRLISSTFSVPSGTGKTVVLNATLYDALGSEQICKDQLYGSGGTLSCAVPESFGNSTVYVSLKVNGVTQGQSYIRLAQDPSDFYGFNLIFLSLIVFITLLGLGITDNPMVHGIMLVIGVIVLTTFNLVYSLSWVGAGATIMWLIVAIILVLIKGGNKR